MGSEWGEDWGYQGGPCSVNSSRLSVVQSLPLTCPLWARACPAPPRPLQNNDLQMIVRAHECVMDGFERFAQGHLITLFRSVCGVCGWW